MGRRLVLLCLLVWTAGLHARQPASLPDDLAVTPFLLSLEQAISRADAAAWAALLSTRADPEDAAAFFASMVPPNTTRGVVRERERGPLAGSLPGEGFRVIAEVLIESGARGAISTWQIDIRRPRGAIDEPQPWRVLAYERLSSVEGLHRLSLDTSRQFTAKNLVVTSVDFELSLPAGQVFVADTADGVTALVLLGDGTMRFTPTPVEERGQLRLFAGTDTLDAAFTAAYLRINPGEFAPLARSEMLAEGAPDPRQLRRAQQIFGEEVSRSFSLDLNDLSRDAWSLLPQFGDFVAEVRTRRFDTLTFARSGSEAEDISLFHRVRKRNIAAYASPQKLASRGRFYNEDDLVEYDVLDYQIDATFTPEREWLEGRARLRLRVKSYGLAALTLRIANDLTVSSVSSDALGRLLFLRVRDQNSIVINLPSPLARDQEMTLLVAYQGRMLRQPIDQEGLLQGRSGAQRPEDIPVVPPEDNWLFSNRNFWYPQGQVSDYATATLRITVPAEYTVVASGLRVTDTPVVVSPATADASARVLTAFSVREPVRYLALIVSRMVRADSATVALERTDAVDFPAFREGDGNGSAGNGRSAVLVTVDANRRQETRGRDALVTTAEILRLYTSLAGDAPYESLALAMVEGDLPGGHSPAYAVLLNNPLPTTPFTWRGDPAALNNFPEFFLAHEIAHQWWGQAVGWKNYHEQWLSEGFAQYFAALYAREKHGEDTFRDILRHFRRWAIDRSDQGAVYLGYRLGHIKSDSRVFRALVYNKGAAVLHMLRLLVGDEAFGRGLRAYYSEFRGSKAGTADFQQVMERASGRELERFFERWIYASALPRLRVSTMVEGNELKVRIEQTGEVFDLPLRISIEYADGTRDEPCIAIGEAITETRFPLKGSVRGVDVNADGATLAIIERP